MAPAADQVTLGIDIAKDTLDVHPHPQGIARRFANDPGGHTKPIARITPKQPTRIVFEATGAHHRALETAPGRAAPPAVKVNPPQARRFAEATGKRVKADKADAAPHIRPECAVPARFGAIPQPDTPPAEDEALDTPAEPPAARQALVKHRTAALNRGRTLTPALLKRRGRQRLKQIETQIQATARQRATVPAANAALKARFNILVSIPGPGAATSLARLVEMPGPGSMDARQTARLAGLAPVTRRSGTWQGKSLIQGGRASLGQAIHMPAPVAIRFNPPLKAKHPALRQAGKPAKLALVAIMRKLVVLANALLRDHRMDARSGLTKTDTLACSFERAIHAWGCTSTSGDRTLGSRS